MDTTPTAFMKIQGCSEASTDRRCDICHTYIGVLQWYQCRKCKVFDVCQKCRKEWNKSTLAFPLHPLVHTDMKICQGIPIVAGSNSKAVLVIPDYHKHEIIEVTYADMDESDVELRKLHDTRLSQIRGGDEILDDRDLWLLAANCKVDAVDDGRGG